MKVSVQPSVKCLPVTATTNTNGWRPLQSLKRKTAWLYQLPSLLKLKRKPSLRPMNFGISQKAVSLLKVFGQQEVHQMGRETLCLLKSQLPKDKYLIQVYPRKNYITT